MTDYYLFDGQKSVPLHRLPPEAFIFLTGGVSGGEVQKLYERVAWLHRGVNVRASTLAGLPRLITTATGDEVAEEELQFKINLADLLYRTESSLTKWGEAYWFVERNRARVLSVRWFAPHTIKPIIDKKEGLIGFSRKRKGQNDLRLDLNKDVVYFWLPSDTDELKPGEAPTMAALQASAIANHSNKFVSNYFERGAIRPVLLELPAATQTSEVERAESWFTSLMTGISNSFRVRAIKSGMATSEDGKSLTVTHIGDLLSDMLLTELDEAKREEIATALGVPHSILFSNAANFATAQADQLNFYEMTILPSAGLIQQAINDQLFNQLGLRLEFTPQLLEIFQQREVEKADALVPLVASGIITIDEARSSLGLPPLTPERPALPDVVDGDVVEEQEQEVESAIVQELRQWRRFVRNRAEQAKNLRGFKTSFVPASLKASIEGALETGYPSHADNIFDNVLFYVQNGYNLDG